jgi:hypothetical protein
MYQKFGLKGFFKGFFPTLNREIIGEGIFKTNIKTIYAIF